MYTERQTKVYRDVGSQTDEGHASAVTSVNRRGDNDPATQQSHSLSATASGMCEQEIFLTTTEILKITETLQIQENQILEKAIDTKEYPTPKPLRNLLQHDLYNLIFNNNVPGNKKIPVLNIEVILNTDPPQKLPCIIDTGCNISLISEKYVPKTVPLDKTDIPNLVTANNIPMKILGSTELTLTVGETELTSKFYVTPELTNPILVGNLFLFKHNMEINYKNQTISITKYKRTTTISMNETWKASISRIHPSDINKVNVITDIRSPEELIIAPHQHRTVITLPTSNRDVFIETDLNLRQKKNGVMLT